MIRFMEPKALHAQAKLLAGNTRFFELCLMFVAFVSVLFSTACRDSDLRGSFAASKDGKTYLAVVDDNGGHCGRIKVDGKVWSYPIGQAGPIDAGHHTIECGGEISFDIRKGVVYKFKYWGP